MGYKNLRQWLARVDELGQLKRIHGAHWELEMGTITELIYREGKFTSPPPSSSIGFLATPRGTAPSSG